MSTSAKVAGSFQGDEIADALAGCARGDQACLRQLYELMSPRMIGVAMRMLRRRDLAEEVVHDTFVRVWEKAASYERNRSPPAAWIFAILRNRSLDVLRGESRIDYVDSIEPMAVSSDEPDAEAIVVALSEASALRQCLERLDPVRRHAIVLVYTRGLSHGELAGRLGIPLGTAKSWIRRSLSMLRECMP